MIDAIKEIAKLKDGESWIWPESDYGKAEIWLKNNLYFLFGIPSYGGAPIFYKAFEKDEINTLVKTVKSWT
ncbi:MAG: hypothetical protein KAW92_10530 [Candidatus Cloacimonetes bacterium]|nr:hypothetical protein [Candidatus Cloacimonadota bacterium]